MAGSHPASTSRFCAASSFANTIRSTRPFVRAARMMIPSASGIKYGDAVTGTLTRRVPIWQMRTGYSFSGAAALKSSAVRDSGELCVRSRRENSSSMLTSSPRARCSATSVFGTYVPASMAYIVWPITCTRRASSEVPNPRSFGIALADSRPGFSMSLLPYLDDIEPGEHPYRPGAGLVFRHDQTKPPLRSK